TPFQHRSPSSMKGRCCPGAVLKNVGCRKRLRRATTWTSAMVSGPAFSWTDRIFMKSFRVSTTMDLFFFSSICRFLQTTVFKLSESREETLFGGKMMILKQLGGFKQPKR